MKLDNPKLFPDLRAAEVARTDLRARGLRLVLTNGCFDLLHPGHLAFLQGARRLGAVLWVALNADESVRELKGPARPVQDESERAYALAALESVGGVLIFRTPRLDAEIAALCPDVYAKAGDYALDSINKAERAALEGCGSEITFLPFLEGYSTTKLIERIARAAGTF